MYNEASCFKYEMILGGGVDGSRDEVQFLLWEWLLLYTLIL